MRIAVEGCCHDELEVIYETVEHIQKTRNTKIDLLLICGDFQATRNPDDLLCMAVPPKFRNMKYFYKYYKGEKTAPVLTLVIGGNHEASNHMQELPYGGWLAPNIYYFGYASIVNVGGVRIGGMSGIYKGKDYHKGHYERPPYDNETLRSAYHTRSLEVFRLKQTQKPVDIMLSHDWPLHAVHAGNVEQLLRWKPDFRDEINQNQLGSPAAQEVMTHIKPSYWFSAHLHCKYPAVIKHQCKEGEEPKITKFLSLDKCLPKRSFLQILDVPHTKEAPFKLELDPEWLVILKNTNHLLNITSTVRYMPGIGCKERYDFRVEESEMSSLLEDFGGDLTLPENFEKTVTPYDGTSDKKKGKQPQCQVNPQTTLLCQMLGLTDPFAVFCGKSISENPDEISVDIESEDSETASQTDSEPGDGPEEGPAPREEGPTAKEDHSASNEERLSTKSDLNLACTVGTATKEDTSANNSILDTTASSEAFPTFIHSLSANESMLNDSNVSELVVSTPVRKLSEMDTGSNAVSEEVVKSPMITPLALPKPQINNQIDASVSMADSRKRCSTDDSAADNTESMDSQSPGTTTTGVKKFKRRNVAMYSILTNQGTGQDEEPT